MSDTERLLPTRAVSSRYSVSDRTLDRWLAVGELPKPVYIRGRRYWPEKALDARDRMRTEAAAERV
jgi:predicted DNA-binding transcriptional regulator AlpA